MFYLDGLSYTEDGPSPGEVIFGYNLFRQNTACFLNSITSSRDASFSYKI